MQTIKRPRATKQKISSKNEFELCYLRHRYFRKVKYNPTEEQMAPFDGIVKNLTKKTYFTYRNLFVMVGLEVEDVINIGQVHLVSFLGLFSLRRTRIKSYKQFVHTFERLTHEKPSQEDILNKNKANFSIFLKQRMEDLVRICRQKTRNIKGLPTEEYYYYYGPKAPPKKLRELIKNYESLGFRKLDSAIYKSIRKQAGTILGATFFFGNNYYIAVPLEQKSLSVDDFVGAGFSPYDTMHNMSPEEALFSLEENQLWEKRRNLFDSKSLNFKRKIIKNFIEANENDPHFNTELRAARKLLKEL